ncbi:MAG: double zinc ribbon domain-containing protein [bacterium]
MTVWIQVQRAIGRPLLDWFAPPRCAGCDRLLAGGTSFCEECSATLLPVEAPLCPVCGAPGCFGLCASCQRRPPPFERARSCYLWGGELARAVRRFKYGSRLELAAPLGQLLGQRFPKVGDAEALVTVPLTRSGLRRRGFNQVVELVAAARRAGAELPPVLPDVLRREGRRPPQASLPPSSRRRLPVSAFRVRRAVRGLSLLLVDDVLTTGSTVRACCAALRRAGARTVAVVTLARVE